MQQPYWVCVSKGYLVYTAHIPPCCGMKNHIYCQVWGTLVPTIEGVPAVMWKIKFIAKFGVPLFPQSRVQLWQIMLFGTYSTYTRLNVESKSHIWPSLGYFAQILKTTMRDIHLCRTANMSWRICVVVKQMQSNPITAIYSREVNWEI